MTSLRSARRQHQSSSPLVDVLSCTNSGISNRTGLLELQVVLFLIDELRILSVAAIGFLDWQRETAAALGVVDTVPVVFSNREGFRRAASLAADRPPQRVGPEAERAVGGLRYRAAT